MDLRRFVADNQVEWKRLEGYVGRVRGRSLAGFGPDELRELGVLHRKVAADLSAVRSAHPRSKVVRYLNDLAIRSHNAVYRAPRRGLLASLRALWFAVPAAARRHRAAIGASATVFVVGTLLGLFGTLMDESVAAMIMGESFVASIQDGEYWIENVFSVMPHSLASARILTNNLGVAIAVYAFGCTGILPVFMMFLNGTMLGSVLGLCAQYELLPRLVPFVTTHGVIEISALIVAGGGGLVVFDAWLHPGDRTRLEALKYGARQGLLVAAAAGPALLIAGPVEGLISPVESVPAALRITLGVGLGLAFWVWLFGVRAVRGA
ncbi:MAG: stage II sporulation protein M [bacterium]|nr:stage II sporulation protein M [bacterium]